MPPEATVAVNVTTLPATTFVTGIPEEEIIKFVVVRGVDSYCPTVFEMLEL
jgi:hypothetical protein